MSGGIITTGSIPKALWPGVNEWFGQAYAQHAPEFPDLFEQFTSDQKYVEDVQTLGFGLANVKPEGSPTSYDSNVQGYISRYTHVAYSKGFIVTHEEMEDNLYAALAKQRSESLAFSMAQTKEIIAANVYNNAFSGTFTGGDGVALISTAHPTVAGNLSNTLTTAAQLSEAAIESLVINIGLMVDDRGLKIAIRPRSLIIPVNLEPDAYRILNSTLQNDSANNATNYLRSAGILPEGIKVNHYFTDTNNWFIRTDCPNGMKHFVREGLKFSQDNDFDTENLKYKAYERYSFNWTDFRQLFGTNPT